MYRISTVFLVLAVLLFASCQQSGTTGNSGSSNASKTVQGLSLDKSAVILFQGCALYTEKDGMMAYATTSNIAETVEWLADIKKALRSSDKAERSFAKIKNADGEFWVQDVFVAAKAIPGVIIAADTVLYKKADVASPSGVIIPINTVVAVHDAQAPNGFTKISAYMPDNKKMPVVTELFVKKDTLVTNSSDIRGLQLWLVAREQKDLVIKKELLKSAMDTGSRFATEIQAELSLLDGTAAAVVPAGSDATRSTEAFTQGFTVNDDNINVRSIPHEVNGTIVGTLSAGTTVDSSERTTETYTVAGFTKRWYRISQPDGWVFGAFLEGAD